MTQYMINHYPYNDLIIYEIGGGNGTLMNNILDRIRDKDPDVYLRTQYYIIEISEKLSALQLQTFTEGPHDARVQIVHKSIFNWDHTVRDPCFILALEVMVNSFY